MPPGDVNGRYKCRHEPMPGVNSVAKLVTLVRRLLTKRWNAVAGRLRRLSNIPCLSLTLMTSRRTRTESFGARVKGPVTYIMANLRPSVILPNRRPNRNARLVSSNGLLRSKPTLNRSMFTLRTNALCGKFSVVTYLQILSKNGCRLPPESISNVERFLL